MAKLIKKSSETTSTHVDISSQPQAESQQGLPPLPGQSSRQENDGRRSATIIDRESFEARSEAQLIRDKAQEQADLLLQEAQKKAESILEQAETSKAEILEQARQEGFHGGQEEGAKQWIAGALKLQKKLQTIEEELLPYIGSIAMQVARKLIGHALESHPETLVQMTKHILQEKARQRREITLRVHPDDFLQLKEARPALLEILSRCKEIHIQEDPQISRFGLIIETEAGSIDARLETQLNAIEQTIEQIARID